MWLARDPDFRAIWRQHPYRNFQSPADRVDDGDRAISPLGSAQDFKSSVLEWVERIEDLDVRSLHTRGIVGEGVFIPICIVSCPVGGSLWTAAIGCPAVPASSCRSRSCHTVFGSSSSAIWSKPMRLENCSSMAISRN